jgi:hypothetical protein
MRLQHDSFHYHGRVRTFTRRMNTSVAIMDSLRCVSCRDICRLSDVRVALGDVKFENETLSSQRRLFYRDIIQENSVIL